VVPPVYRAADRPQSRPVGIVEVVMLVRTHTDRGWSIATLSGEAVPQAARRASVDYLTSWSMTTLFSA
jgi:hypothetical protein